MAQQITITFEDFGDNQSIAANKLCDFLEGSQLKYVIQALNGGNGAGYGFRWDWANRGFVPRMRNITLPIVEKSASNLFVKPPKYEILPASSSNADPIVDPRLNELFTIADFNEFGRNWNIYSRALRSVVILQQKIIGAPSTTVDGIYKFNADNGDLYVPTLLHRGNSVVRMNQARSLITELAWLAEGNPSDDQWSYYYINSDVEELVKVVYGKEVSRTAVNKDPDGNPIGNPDGFVPAVMHYDTKKPLHGIWHHIPEDIVALQELVNTFLTDLEFAVASQMGQTLFTDADFRSAGDSSVPTAITRAGTPSEKAGPAPKQRPPKAAASGIGAVVQLKAGKDQAAPYLEFKGPDVDLSALQAVVQSHVAAVSEDWSVTMKMAGDAAATSGFQLIVEELDNMNLREQRIIMFQATLRRMYSQLKQLYPELQDGQLVVDFPPASLPVNQKEQEQIWDLKIAGGRASVVDYLMSEEGLSVDEAKARAADIKANNTEFGQQPAATTITPPSEAQ